MSVSDLYTMKKKIHPNYSRFIWKILSKLILARCVHTPIVRIAGCVIIKDIGSAPSFMPHSSSLSHFLRVFVYILVVSLACFLL